MLTVHFPLITPGAPVRRRGDSQVYPPSGGGWSTGRWAVASRRSHL